MLAEVQAALLIFGSDPQANNCVNHLQNDEGSHKGKDYGNSGSDQLDAELAGVAEKEPVRSQRVNCPGGKEAGGKNPDHPADSVYPYHVKGIIIAQPCFPHNRAKAGRTGNKADHKR